MILVAMVCATWTCCMYPQVILPRLSSRSEVNCSDQLLRSRQDVRPGRATLLAFRPPPPSQLFSGGGRPSTAAAEVNIGLYMMQHLANGMLGALEISTPLMQTPPVSNMLRTSQKQVTTHMRDCSM